MKIPFIPSKRQEHLFRAFLRKYTGWDAKTIRRQAEQEDFFLTRELVYSEVQEIFDAGWDACEKEIAKK